MRTKRHLQKKTVTKKYKKINLTKQIKKQKLKKTRINKLVGGDGDNTVQSKIMICTRNQYKYLMPVLEYLERRYNFMASHINIIYANNTLPPPLKFPATLYSTILETYVAKPKAILIEAIEMGTHPFIIYIDDENEIISNIYGKTVFDTNIKKEFYFELCSYNETEPYNENKSYKKIEMSSITEDMKKDPKNLNLLEGIINTIPENSGLCLCIQLPHEQKSICDDKFFKKIQNILSFINTKFNNNLLTVFDFDNTLTNLHLYKSIHRGMEKYTEKNETEFSNAFLTQPSSDELKKAQIKKYFGTGNIKKIISLFQIVKSIEKPANSKKPLPLPANSKKSLPQPANSKKLLSPANSKKLLTPANSKKLLPLPDNSKKLLPPANSKKPLPPPLLLPLPPPANSKKPLPPPLPTPLPPPLSLPQNQINSSSTNSSKQNLETFLLIKRNKKNNIILSFCDCKIILVYIVYYKLLNVTNLDNLLQLINTEPVQGDGKGSSSENRDFISNSVGNILKFLYPDLTIYAIDIFISSCSKKLINRNELKYDNYDTISEYLLDYTTLYNILFKNFEDKNNSIYYKFDDLFLAGGGVKSDKKPITLDDINKLFTNVTINNAAAKVEEASAEAAEEERKKKAASAVTKSEEAAAKAEESAAASAAVLTIPKEVSVKDLNSSLTFTLTRKPNDIGQSFTITNIPNRPNIPNIPNIPNRPKNTNSLIPLTKKSLELKSNMYVIDELALGKRFKVAIKKKSNSNLLKSLNTLTKKKNSKLLNSPYPDYINKYAKSKIEEYEAMVKPSGLTRYITQNTTKPQRQTLLQDIIKYRFSRQDIENLIRLQHYMPTILKTLIDGEKIVGMFRLSGLEDTKKSFYTDSNFSLTKEVLEDTHILCSLVKEYIKFLSKVKGSYFEEEIKNDNYFTNSNGEPPMTKEKINELCIEMYNNYLSYYEGVDQDLLYKIFVLFSLIMNNETTKMTPEAIGKMFLPNVEPRATTFASTKRHSMYTIFFEYIKDNITKHNPFIIV